MPPHSRKRRKRRSSQQSIDKLSQFIEKTSIPATLPSINKDRSISHENNEVKSQRIERIANSPRRLAKTAAWSNKNKLASDFHSKTQTLTKMKDGSEKTDADGNYVSPRRKSVSERFQMIQHKVGTMGALQNGGARRRASIRIEEKPLSQEQRRSILDKIGSLDVLSDDAKDKFADALQARVYGKGEKIIEEGEIGAEFYIIEIGKVEVTRSDPINYGQEKVLAKLGNHDFFGEIALLVDAPRSATVRTLETTTVLYAGRDIFQKLMSPIQESVSKTRKNELMNAVLTNVSLFNPLTPLEQRKLIDVMGNAQYKEGDVICRQGDIGNSMYIILEGAVKVMIPTGKNDDDDDDNDDDNDDNDNNGNKGKKKSFRHMKKKEVFRYHRFGYFGELALVNADSKRTADCVAVGDCKCLFLHRIHFNSCPRLAEAIGLKNMFQGFGSRKQVESDNAEVRKMRRRQSFVSTKGSGDEEDEDEEADANGSTKSSRAGSPKGSPSGSPRSRRGSTSSFDDNENEGLMSAFNFNKKSTNRSRSNSKIMGMFGGGAGGKMSLKSKVQSMIKKKRTSDFMALVHEAIQKKKELRANLCTPVIERVHVKPELMDRFTEISSKIDWIDRENGADDLMKHVRIALSTLPVQRTEEQVGLIYTVIENLNVWNTMCVKKNDFKVF